MATPQPAWVLAPTKAWLMKTPRKKQVPWWFLLCLSIFLVGCAGGGAMSYSGRPAKPESRVMEVWFDDMISAYYAEVYVSGQVRARRPIDYRL